MFQFRSLPFVLSLQHNTNWVFSFDWNNAFFVCSIEVHWLVFWIFHWLHIAKLYKTTDTIFTLCLISYSHRMWNTHFNRITSCRFYTETLRNWDKIRCHSSIDVFYLHNPKGFITSHSHLKHVLFIFSPVPKPITSLTLLSLEHSTEIDELQCNRKNDTQIN